MKNERKVMCPYCGKQAELVKGWQIYPNAGTWGNANFWACFDCQAWVGCHRRNRKYGRDGDEPLGRLANSELRNAKRHVHRLLDPLWQQKGMKRSEAYQALSRRLGIAAKDCHVGEFDVERCRAAYRALQAMHKELWEVSHERYDGSDESPHGVKS